jgi:serine/threonine-protein kinase
MASSHHRRSLDPTPPVRPFAPEVVPAAPVIPPNADDATVITHRQPGSSGSPRPTAPFELGKLLAGERLDHFELLEYVGGGGMGAVFRARDTMLNREVALKVLSRDQGADDETRRRFQNEAQSAARLDHENIARVYYVGEDRGLNYIVFEFIEGINIRDLVEQRGGPLSLAEAISFTLQIARALEHAASREVVHRDIKPSNVLITANGRAKLVDMGLARLHQVDATGHDLTASGVTLGTFDYISPEQARDPRSADVRSDMYSLGCTLYFMVTARPPFPEGTVLQKLLQHNSDEPPDPREFNPDLPEGLTVVVRKMLAKNPRRRYQTPSELIHDLMQFADEAGVPASSWGGPTAVTAPPAELTFLQRHLPWAVPVAALIIIVLGLEFLSSSSISGSSGFPNENASQVAATASGSTEKTASSSEKSPDRAAESARSIPVPDQTTEPMPPTKAGTTSVAVSQPSPMPSEVVVATAPSTNNAGTSQETVRTTDSAIDPMPRPGVLIVSPNAQGPQQFTSLRAACSQVKNGEVIELRYNGPREERPITLNNLKFTIRAGQSYQPTLVFRPDEIDPVRYPRSMLTVAGGRLTLINVAMELHIPSPADVPAKNWALFEAQRSDLIDLESCSLSISNATGQGMAYHSNVAFFSVAPAPGHDSMMASEDVMGDQPVNIELKNCLARGEATFLATQGNQPVRLSWNNGLLATSERFLATTGATSEPRRDANHRIDIELRHLTANIGPSFCQITNSSEAPYSLDTAIKCSDSILFGAPGAALIEQQGLDTVATLERQIAWIGDRNFYQGFDSEAVWRIVNEQQPDQPKRLSVADWQMHWGQDEFIPTWGEVGWKQLPVDVAVHLRTPHDYALGDQMSDNKVRMARNSASDGRDVGMISSLLPSVKAEEAKVGAGER